MAEQKIDKEQKYDRQLRLWGANGQAKLESSNLALLTADALGSETLKNLILPGIGNFTIVDDAKVTELDLGTNFFVESSSVGKSRAEEVTRLLQELNPDSKGKSIVKSVSQMIDDDLSAFDAFSHVIASNVNEQSMIKLAAYLWEKDIPLIILKSNGFFGYMRLIKQEHNIIETKTDNAPDDLRVSEPFPKLLEYSQSFSLDKMTSAEHSHHPWVCILVAHTQKWRDEHDGALPTTRDEKKAYRQSVRELAKGNEENFAEAYQMAHNGYMPYVLGSAIRDIFAHKNCNPETKLESIHASGQSFWAIARAVKAFVDNEGKGKLPVAGGVPDLTATTDGYLALQKLYQDQAKADVAAVMTHLSKQVGEEKANEIGKDAVSQFCRHGNSLKHLAYRSLADEYKDASSFGYLLNDKDSDAHWYVVFRASASLDGSETTDEEKLTKLTKATEEIVKQMGASNGPGEERLKHWLRSNQSQLHNTAAVLGGLASQEAIKLITEQYIPAGATTIWNGMVGRTASF